MRRSLQGQSHHIRSEEQLAEFKRTMQTLGFYWQEMDPEEYASYEGQQDRIDDLFDVLAKERLAEWVTLAEERLAGTRVKVYLCGGNDDTDEVLTALDETAGERVRERGEPRRAARRRARAARRSVLDADAVGDTRERTDEEIAEVIEKLMPSVSDPTKTVFNFHCPPLDSGLDTCLKLDASVWPPKP